MGIRNWIHGSARFFTIVVLLFGSTAARAQLIGCSKSQVVPVATNDYVTWPGGEVVVDVLGNDYDQDGDPLAITAFSPGANGTVRYTEDFEALIYTPTNTSATTDQFSYSISDGQFTIPGTVFLTADPVEPPPPPPPPAEVTITYSCSNAVCHFTATWTGIPDTPRYFHWQFSDGSSTPAGYNIPNASNGFSPGTHWAKVTITFVSGIVKESAQFPVQVETPSIVCTWEGGPAGLYFNARVKTVTAANGQPIQYDNFRYFWDFQDGNSPGEADHFLLFQTLYGTKYRTPGTRTINFIVKTSDLSTIVGQCPQLHEFTNDTPIPDFEAQPGDGVTRARKLFKFIPTAYDEYYFELGPWEWNFGDGGTSSTSGPTNVDHYYPRPGNYTVTLKVTDSLGAVGTKEKTITVPDDPPVAAWQFNCKGRKCTFDASLSSDDSEVVTYRWNFGDNTPVVSVESRAVEHTFAADGAYDVTLTVDDGTNQVSKARRVSPRGAALTPGLVFYTLPPCRVVDTRLQGRPPLTSNAPVDFTVAGLCGVPADAKAVAANATVVSPTEAVRVYLYPTGASSPIGSTVISTPERSPRANNTILPLGAEGSITARPVAGTTGTTHLVIDVTGYFSESLTGIPPARGPMRYERSAVYRLYDSRTQSAPLTAGSPRLLDLRYASFLALPLAAEAHALNITAINPSNTAHFVLYPSDLPAAPTTSILNVQGGISQSNGSFMGLSRRDNDDVAITFAGTSTHFTVDTYGWFAKDATYRYYPIEPCRAFDSREATNGSPRIPANSNRSVQIQGNCGVPYGAKYAVTTARIVSPDAAGAAQVGSIYDQSITNIQYAAGDSITNTLIVALGGIPAGGCCTQDMPVTLTGGGADVAVDVLGYFLPEINQPPAAAPESVTAVINVPLTIDVLANDSDANGDTIKLSPTRPIFNPPLLGTAARASDTSVTYNSALAGDDVFDYEVLDTRGGVSHGRVTVTVRATNGAPVASPDSGSTASNSSVTVDVLANDSDPDGDPLRITAVTAPAKGTAQIKIDRILYTPNATANGTDTFHYTIGDEFGATASAAVTITISGANNPPHANEDSATVYVGETVAITPVANDSDPDGDTLKLSDPAITEAPALGTAVRTNDTTITYTAGQTAGPDVFQYSIHDGRGGTSRGAITVTVQPTCTAAPVISAQPASSTLNAGASTTLTVTASGGSKPLTYQWYQGAAPSTTSPVGTNSNSLTVTPSATTSYWVRVTNACGSTASSTAVVTVCSPLGIATQPASQSITIGTTATLSVAASGSGPFAYQWYEGAAPSTATPVGTNSPTFTTPALTANKSYWVRVTSTCNGSSSVDSMTANITVTCSGAPAITAQPTSRTINAGASTTLTVTATQAASYQWYEGTAPSTATPVGTNSNSLTVTPSATKSYWVNVTNSCGPTASATATVTVCQPAGIATQPASQSITAGSTATLTVAASGSGPFNYQWYEGTAPATTTPVGTNSPTFTTPALSATKSYWVRVTSTCNGSTSVNSTTATVTVTCANPPVILNPPVSRTINAGQSATLTITVDSVGPTTFQWYQGAAGVTTTPVGTNSPSLTISPSATTSYWVKVTNACGSTSSPMVTVTVCTPAGISTQPASRTIPYNTTTTLTVTPSGSGPFTHQWYQGASGTTTTPVGTNSASFTTPALTATTSYWVKVTSTCNGTASVNSNTATVTVTCAAAPAITAQPTSRTINAGQPTTLTVTASSPGSTPSYQWYQGTAPSTTTPVGTNSNSLTVTPGATTNYWVRITNACGATNSTTATVTVCALPAITAHPASTTIAYNATATLSVAAGGSAPLSYQWYEGASGVTTTPVGTNSSSFTTPALTATKSYWVKVTSTCNGTASANSNAATVTVTPQQIARRQTSFALADSQTSITANWTQPTQAGNLLVAVITGDKSPNGVITWTAPAGWIQAATYETTNVKASIYYIPNNAGGRTSETFTVAAGFHEMILHLLEYSGVMTVSPLDKTAFNGDNSNDGYLDTGYTPNTVQPKELVITVLTTNVTTEFHSPSNGFTELYDHTRSWWDITSATHERITTAANSWGHYAQVAEPGAEWVGLVATFKAANTN